MHSAIYHGWLRHRRFTPRAHAFRYRLFLMYLDLAEIDRIFEGRWLWSSARRAALARFERSDYLGDPAIPLDVAVRNRVEIETGRRPTGPIRLLTHLRYFGYCFNPVSFYYCFDADDTHVETIVAEVTNTPWRERHCYVLHDSEGPRTEHFRRFHLQKQMHVSPFMPMDVAYRWGFSTPGPTLAVHMALHREDKVFDATMTLERAPVTGRTLAQALLRFPLMTLKVVAAIHWEALRLWCKRVPVHTHPGRLANSVPLPMSPPFDEDAREAKRI